MDIQRKVAATGRAGWRRMTAAARMRPHYIIIGAQKCGTDSLCSWLEGHPQVAPAKANEIYYFDNHYQRGERWYREHFPLAAGRRLYVTGEATPTYLLHPLAAERMARDLPDVRLIVLLRDPVARAWSHYHHSVRWKFEALPFADAIAAEEQRLEGEEARMRMDQASISKPYRSYSYRKRGLYLEQLRRYYDRFDRKQILVLKSESLFADPQGEFNRVLRFLGLSPMTLRDPPVRNKGHYQGTIMDSAPELAKELYDYFRPHNQALYEFLGTDFNWEANGEKLAN